MIVCFLLFFSSRSKEIVSDKVFTIRLLETLTEKSSFLQIGLTSNSTFLTFSNQDIYLIVALKTQSSH